MVGGREAASPAGSGCSRPGAERDRHGLPGRGVDGCFDPGPGLPVMWPRQQISSRGHACQRGVRAAAAGRGARKATDRKARGAGPSGTAPRVERPRSPRYSFQIRSAYSLTERSLEKNPQRATLRMALRVHASRSRYAASTASCAAT